MMIKNCCSILILIWISLVASHLQIPAKIVETFCDQLCTSHNCTYPVPSNVSSEPNTICEYCWKDKEGFVLDHGNTSNLKNLSRPYCMSGIQFILCEEKSESDKRNFTYVVTNHTRSLKSGSINATTGPGDTSNTSEHKLIGLWIFLGVFGVLGIPGVVFMCCYWREKICCLNRTGDNADNMNGEVQIPLEGTVPVINGEDQPLNHTSQV